MSPWMQYTLARLGLFLVPLVIMIAIGVGWFWSSLFATLISLALSILFLNPLRARLSTEISKRVQKPAPDIDSDIEDSQIKSAKD
ncbi:MAG: DUF4229 domain-containing protein [Microbacteriaceae bacterium]|nr:DUF4229 domain-containing protein [Microbacteriaceae bacterium]